MVGRSLSSAGIQRASHADIREQAQASVTERDLPDLMRNDAREKRRGSYAAMVLHLDSRTGCRR
jgi:hypothetical protein